MFIVVIYQANKIIIHSNFNKGEKDRNNSKDSEKEKENLKKKREFVEVIENLISKLSSRLESYRKNNKTHII